MPEIEHHPLRPFLPCDARLLMLGSFPPPRQRWCVDFFYPNRSNMMWEVMGLVFYGDAQRLVDAEHKTFRKDDIIAMLNAKGIAIYDTATAVRRLQGNASDKFLEVVEKTDIAALLRQIPHCHDVVCTGQKATETLCSDYGAQQPHMGESTTFEIDGRTMRLHRMPSTSRAFPMPLTKKAAYYEKMMRQVGCLDQD